MFLTQRGAGCGHVNAYWVLPPATAARLKLAGETLRTFHPVRALEQKVKAASETVKEDAEKVKPAVQTVKPASPRTVINHQEPSRTTTVLRGETLYGCLEARWSNAKITILTTNHKPGVVADRR